MNRRKFLGQGLVAAVGSTLLPEVVVAQNNQADMFRKKQAKNIIVLVSDGMSAGTLNMANVYSERLLGKTSNWISLYQNNEVVRGVMDMASANSIVTDSSAASSSWGGGARVNNGALNIGPKGEENLPIWHKMKAVGKKIGVVTTVPVTHATPAGFCVMNKSRNAQPQIALDYLELKLDIILGGGQKYFDSNKREDKQDVYSKYRQAGYHVCVDKNEMSKAKNNQPILGVFAEDALPYQVDRNNQPSQVVAAPSLAEMTSQAIAQMKNHSKGFALQIESGKVDWAAHANDVAGLIHEQLQFDEAIQVAMDFAREDGETLVIITSDHGNANPGTIYGKKNNERFDALQQFTASNEAILNTITADFSAAKVRELIEQLNGFAPSEEEAKHLLSFYQGVNKTEDGLYNYRKVPFYDLAVLQGKNNSIGWISMDHSGDYVELAAYGPGSENIKGFQQNIELHHIILKAAGIKNDF